LTNNEQCSNILLQSSLKKERGSQNMEIFLKIDEKPDVDEMAKFLMALPVEAQRNIENFLTGFKFGQANGKLTEPRSTIKTA